MRKYSLVILCDKCLKEFHYSASDYSQIIAAVNIAFKAGTIVQTFHASVGTREFCSECDPSKDNYARYK